MHHKVKEPICCTQLECGGWNGREDVWRDWEWAVCMVCVYGRRVEWERGYVEEGVGRSRELCRTEATMVNLPHLESRTVHHLQRLKQSSVDMQTSLTTPCPCTTASRETYSRLSLVSALPSSENQDCGMAVRWHSFRRVDLARFSRTG